MSPLRHPRPLYPVLLPPAVLLSPSEALLAHRSAAQTLLPYNSLSLHSQPVLLTLPKSASPALRQALIPFLTVPAPDLSLFHRPVAFLQLIQSAVRWTPHLIQIPIRTLFLFLPDSRQKIYPPPESSRPPATSPSLTLTHSFRTEMTLPSSLPYQALPVVSSYASPFPLYPSAFFPGDTTCCFFVLFPCSFYAFSHYLFIQMQKVAILCTISIYLQSTTISFTNQVLFSCQVKRLPYPLRYDSLSHISTYYIVLSFTAAPSASCSLLPDLLFPSSASWSGRRGIRGLFPCHPYSRRRTVDSRR